MRKSDLLNWLQDANRDWQGVLEQFGLSRMEQPGVAGPWSMKDVVAHLTGWNRLLVDRLRAAQQGAPEPPPPWPAQLDGEDEINAWIDAAYRERSLREVLDESQQVFQQLVTIIEGLPDDARIETIRGSSGRDYYLLWIGEKRFAPGEFFDHYEDDHAPDIRTWLEQHPAAG